MRLRIRDSVMLALIALMVLMVPAALACIPPPPEPGLSPGFWKHEVRAHLPPGLRPHAPRGAMHYSSAEMAAFVLYINTYIMPGFDILWAYDHLWDNAYKDTWLEVANWFNEAAGLGPYP